MTRTVAQEPPRRLISLNEAANLTGLSERTLRRYVSEGRLPGYRVGPRALRVRATDLDRLVSHRLPTAPYTFGDGEASA